MSYEIPPGHMPMVLLRPEQYQRLNAGLQRPSYFTYSIMFKASMAIQDFWKAAIQSTLIDKLSAAITTETVRHSGLCAAARTLSYAELSGRVLDAIEQDGQFLNAAWKAGIGAGMGGSYASAIEQYMGSGQLLYAYKNLRYQTAITPRLRRHWNMQYTPAEPNLFTAWQMFRRGLLEEKQLPLYGGYDGWSTAWIKKLKAIMETIPNPRAAFRMYTRGDLTRKQFNDYCFQSGWPAAMADKLFGMYEWLPTAHEAFYMHRKGLITAAQKKELYKAHGYQEKWHAALEGNFEYVPTLYDLTRMADYVELGVPWMTSVLRKRGLNPSDIAKIVSYLQIRPLREERRDIVKLWIQRYKLGRCSIDELGDALDALQIASAEKTLLVYQAEISYQDELIDEQVDILIWKFRTAIISAEDFLEGLTNLGIKEEKANLMVEAEEARGYYGYY